MPYKDIEDRRVWDRKNYKKHKRKINKRHKIWNQKHKEEKKKYDKSYRKKHIKRRMLLKKLWCKNNPAHDSAIKILKRWRIRSTPPIINLLKLYFETRRIVKGEEKNEEKLKIYFRDCRDTCQSC